jgi:hypothetical protein
MFARRKNAETDMFINPAVDEGKPETAMRFDDARRLCNLLDVECVRVGGQGIGDRPQ